MNIPIQFFFNTFSWGLKNRFYDFSKHISSVESLFSREKEEIETLSLEFSQKCTPRWYPLTAATFFDHTNLYLWHKASCRSESESLTLPMKDQKCEMCWCSLFFNIQASSIKDVSVKKKERWLSREPDQTTLRAAGTTSAVEKILHVNAKH